MLQHNTIVISYTVVKLLSLYCVTIIYNNCNIIFHINSLHSNFLLDFFHDNVDRSRGGMLGVQEINIITIFMYRDT